MGRENLSHLLAQLNVESGKDDSAKVEEICRQLLEKNCDNPGSILRAGLVAAIKQDKYSLGLKLIEENKLLSEKYEEQFALEALYIYYKLNKTIDFENLYSKLNLELTEPNNVSNFRGLLHVRAQFCYKQGLYEEAFKIYQFLSSHNDRVFDNPVELACNERVPLAVAPHLQDHEAVLSKVSENSFDLLFNDSMILSARGEYDEAVKLLEEAREMAASDGVESDIEAIELQMAYVFQMQGKNDLSHGILDQFLKKGKVVSPFTLLAKMNKKSFNDFSKYSDNLNLILRELNFKQLDSVSSKHYTHEQSTIIKRNCLFLHLFNNNSIQYGSTLLSRTLHNYGKLVGDISFESYRTQAKKVYHQAIKMIKSGIKGSVIGFLLLAIQLLVVEKQLENAIRLCEHFLNEFWKSPGPVSDGRHHSICFILFELYKLTGRDHSKSILLKKLSCEKESVSNDIIFWKHVGLQHLSLGNVKQAKEILKEVSLYCDDKAVRRVLSEEALTLEDSLDIIQEVDVEELLNVGVQPLESWGKADRRVGASKIQKKRILMKNKKKKEQRVQKFLQNRELNKGIDPERWLPLKDRSSYRPKKKQGLTKQTQGGAMNKKVEQALDITKKVKKPAAGPRKKKHR